MRPKVFLSGGFNTNWQQLVISAHSDKFYFHNPREHGLESAQEYTVWDVHQVKNSDIVFAYMEQTNPSGYGLALEIGLANALNKTIILVDERSISDKSFERYFHIVRHSASIVFDRLEDGISFLGKFSPNLV